MRLEIVLEPNQMRFAIPINYNYPLSSQIEKIFSNELNNFSEWVRITESKNGRNYLPSYFTFSKLYNSRMRVQDYMLIGFGDCIFTLSSPVEDESINDFVIEVLKNKSIFIGNKFRGSDFSVKRVENRPEPELDGLVRFTMLSPTTISKSQQNKGMSGTYFLRPNEAETESALEQNLRKKYEMIYNRSCPHLINIKLDKNYIRSKGGSDSISKLITIKEGTADEQKLKGFVTPLTIESHSSILKIAYTCGIGDLNHFGLGMLESVDFKPPVISSRQRALEEARRIFA